MQVENFGLQSLIPSYLYLRTSKELSVGELVGGPYLISYPRQHSDEIHQKQYR
jgi:hypothetical protein